MPERNVELTRLITKHLQHALTAHERELLDAWLAERSQNRAFLQSLENERNLQEKLHTYHAIDRQRVWRLVQAKLAGQPATPVERTSRPVRWFAYVAAAVVLMALIGTWVFFPDETYESNTGMVGQSMHDVPPGGNRATLTLADGRTVDLSEAQAGIIVADGITYLDGSQVLATEDRRSKTESQEGNPYGITKSNPTTSHYALSTPKGGTYQVTLPDGTQVWLNAASTLRYPARFDGHERRVEIDGEGYFLIAKDAKKPFRVFSQGQEIDVLGTEFNVSAYGDENTVKTTLVNGAIAVRNPASDRLAKLSPGQQSTIRGSETTIEQVETNLFTNWKNGVFSFKKTPAGDVMKQLARWYDVEIVYQRATPPTATFSGEMSRDVSLRTVLEFLELSGIGFRLENRKLIIE